MTRREAIPFLTAASASDGESPRWRSRPVLLYHLVERADRLVVAAVQDGSLPDRTADARRRVARPAPDQRRRGFEDGVGLDAADDLRQGDPRGQAVRLSRV